MSVSLIEHWETPGCGIACVPRKHDIRAHEAFGFRLGLIAATVEPVRVVRTGPLVVDLVAQTAYVDGREVRPSPNEWLLLACLADRPGHVIAIDEVARAIWGRAYVAAMTSRRAAGGWIEIHHRHHLRVLVTRLRQRLGPAGYLIENRVGRGYRLHVEPVPAEFGGAS